VHPCRILILQTQSELEQYYDLRWRILRKPWNQPKGSEKDEIENECIHVIAKYNDDIIGVGRLQFNSKDEAQIRYMAVEPDYEKQDVGKKIVGALEGYVRENKRTMITLDAREPAVGFYEKLGYTKKEKTYLLFNKIQHYKMRKTVFP